MFRRLIIGLIVLFLGFMSFPQAPQASASANQQLIIINKKINKLAFYEKGKLVKIYPVATGKTRSLTPEGTFYIRAKQKNRPWYKENIPGGAPNNPLGKRWMELSKWENGYPYGIHGNANESSIGKWVSHGCVRMHNWDVEKLYDMVKVGAKVKITWSSQTFNQLAKPFFKNLDATAPKIPTVNTVGDNSTTVTGKTEAKVTVTVTIGSKKYSKTASSKGNFSIKIPKQKAGKKLSVTATDKAGNVSKPRSVTVQDKTAPVLTVKPVSDKDKVVYVKTEKGASVTVKNGTWTSKGTQAKTSGYFKIALPNKPKAYSKVTVISKDKAKNAVTKSVTVADKTIPTITVNPVSDQSKTVSGKTEAGATVTLSFDKNHPVKADGNGKFSYKLSKNLKSGTKFTVTAKDRAGHAKSATVTVADKTAPSISVDPVTDQSTQVTVKTETGAAVTVSMGSGTSITATAIDSNGTYQATIPPQEAGTIIKVTAKDKAGNSSTVTITVTKTTNDPEGNPEGTDTVTNNQ
ncbi:L,D-transpeptidase family protein [Neobacillus sp. YIM B02564]|uniref:L,D-transpeptidase family protein n=1 Tax=Neobacillus paridis TaxID=2803862 RepID=A0ABS1TN08_9BACI|nr:L,D-transpeptidase family protein [Neobacillus paridis]